MILPLDYISNSIVFMLLNFTIAMYTFRRIEGDIGKELYVTHNLTKISSKMAMILRRFNALEEGVIELVRMEHNTESIKIETPSDINTEVKKILVAARKKERINTGERPKTPKKIKISTSTYHAVNESQVQNPLTKFSAIQPSSRGKIDFLEISNSTMSKGENRSSLEKPLVKLLTEKKMENLSQPIGFRPSWKCES
ncbi:uncharacterized protein [Venturia canescens]|uniref:uncharacterized protein isoform X2 n=1 Tax=Venturia canescens TaxID=32260 RepID=UPI001C9C0AA1|nr:uncharacterized protein LOC122408410 isoform X2 [Venturia canescens]